MLDGHVEVPHLADAEKDRYSSFPCSRTSMLVLHGGVV